MSNGEKWIHGTKDICAAVEHLLPEKKWTMASIRYYIGREDDRRIPVTRLLGQTSIRQSELEAWARARRAEGK